MRRRDVLRAMGVAAMGPGREGAGAGPGAPAGPLARPIPATGETLPVVGLGTWQTFDVGGDRAGLTAARAVLAAFAELGGRLVDSSPMYGTAEEVTGELAADLGLHDRLFVATKVWTTGREAGLRQMEQSRRRLRVRRVDLMQVHNLLDVETHLATLERLKADGAIRYLGVTHYTDAAHQSLARLVATRPVDFLQVNYSAGERAAERRLLPLARERGVAVIANRPFAGGDLLRRLRARPLPAWAGAIACTSWAQVLLKFVVSHPAVTCAIPATSRVEHLRDNMAAGLGPLPDAALRARIAAAAVE